MARWSLSWGAAADPPQTKAAAPALPTTAWAPVGVQPGRPAAPASDAAGLLAQYTRSELVYAAIQRRARSSQGPHLRVQTRSAAPTADWTAQAGHPLRRLLMRPNPLMDEAAFFAAEIVSRDVSGRFYAEIVRDGLGLPVELWPLSPAKVAPIYDSRGVPTGYEYKDGGQKIVIPAMNMLTRSEYDPAAPRTGAVSRLAVCLGAVDADSAQTDFVRAFFGNAGVPSGILKVKGTLKQPEVDLIKSKWRGAYGRLWGRQHEVAVLDDNADYQQIGSNLADLDSQTLRHTFESRVCMTFDVPPLIIYAGVGLARSIQSNLKEAWRNWWDSTLAPLYAETASWLTWALLPEYVAAEQIYAERIRLAWDFTEVPAYQMDVTERQTRARANFAAGGLTLNEFRTEMGEQPDPVGDYYLRPALAQAVPAGQRPPPLPAAPRIQTLPPGGTKAAPPLTTDDWAAAQALWRQYATETPALLEGAGDGRIA